MRAGKIVLVVFGALLTLAGLGFAAGGGTLLWAHTTQRDAGGFYNTPTDLLGTSTYALTASVDFGTNASQGDLWVPVHPAGTVRIRASAVNGQALFVGIGPTASVDSWLAAVAHEHVTSIGFGPFSTDTQPVAGTQPATPPGTQSFWVASATGTGRQSLVWPTQSGRWTAVVMNAGAAPGVAADVSVGMQTGLLLPIGIGLGVFGLFVLALAALLLYLGLRQEHPEAQAPPTWAPPAVGSAPAAAPPPAPASVPAGSPTVAAYPVRLDGHIDPTTSPWLWVVKWVLVIPHAFVLAFLWLAVTVLTVVAGFAILFTERYPRSIFDFNVGVMRWTWRVAFYSASAFGTDRYPPFSLAPDPTYPADLQIDYPQRLSRGLVLVKWWLLAIPHFVVVAIFAGGLGFGLFGAWRAAAGVGLILVLAVVAAVMRAVQGRYPDPLFDFIMGMNRWCYRVLAYVALMRDEYPPFRLDSGGTDPGSIAVLPPAPPPSPTQTDDLIGSAR